MASNLPTCVRYEEVPQHVEYELTDKENELCERPETLLGWANQYARIRRKKGASKN